MPVSLLHPGLFAIGLACVSIPIIIHLLKRRRRVISWGAMRFLEEAYRKRRRIITLEQLILLALRCLLIALIALGVGSLMLGSGSRSSEPTTLTIVLDDSIGSAIVVDGAAAIDTNKRNAIELIESLDTSRGDRVALISASAPARAVVLPASDDLGAVLALLNGIEPSDAPLDLAGVAALLGQSGDDENERSVRRVLMLASDARTVQAAMNASDQSPARVAFDSIVLAKPGEQPAVNTGIVDARLTRAMIVRDGLPLPEAVRVELMRSGEGLGEQRSTIRVLDQRGSIRGQAQIDWARGQREAALSVAIDTQGLNTNAGSSSILRVRIDEDANPRDNTCLLTLPVRDTLRVGIIDRPGAAPGVLGGSGGIGPSRWARAALAPSGGMGVEVTSIDARQAESRLTPSLDAVIVLAPNAMSPAAWDRVERLREQGTMVVVTPDAQIESLAWFDRIRAMAPEVFAAGERTLDHNPPATVNDRLEAPGLLSGIAGELPQLSGAVEVYRSLSIPEGARPIASLSDGTPLGVSVSPVDDAGPIVVLSVPLDLGWSNLPTRPLFVAMMQELVRQGVGEGVQAKSTIAGEPIAQLRTSQSARRVTLPDEPIKPDQTHELNQLAGVLALRDAQGSVRSLRVVRPAASGASADTISQEDLVTQLERLVSSTAIEWIGDRSGTGNADSVTISSTDARSLALWMLWAAFIIASIEFILARLFTARLIASERAMGAGSGGARA